MSKISCCSTMISDHVKLSFRPGHRRRPPMEECAVTIGSDVGYVGQGGSRWMETVTQVRVRWTEGKDPIEMRTGKGTEKRNIKSHQGHRSRLPGEQQTLAGRRTLQQRGHEVITSPCLGELQASCGCRDAWCSFDGTTRQCLLGINPGRPQAREKYSRYGQGQRCSSLSDEGLK